MTYEAKDAKRDLICNRSLESEWLIFKDNCCLEWSQFSQTLEKILDLSIRIECSIPAFSFCPWCGHSINK